MRYPIVSAIAMLVIASPASLSAPLEIAMPELSQSSSSFMRTEQRHFKIHASIDQPNPPRSLLKASHITDPMTIELRASELASLIRSDLLEVDSPNGLRTIEIDELLNRTPRISILKGRLMDSPRSHVLLTRVDDAIAGSIKDYESGEQFELRHGEDGRHWIYSVEPHSHAQCGGSPTAPPDLEEQRLANLTDAGWLDIEIAAQDQVANSTGDSVPLAACTAPMQPIIDYAVFYTTLAKQAIGGQSAIEALALYYVEWTNQAYINSNLDLRLRLVYCGETTYDEQPGSEYDPNSPFREHLSRFSSRPEYSSIRASYRADAAMLLLADNSLGGFAWLCANNVGLTNGVMFWNNGPGTFAHEYGHNQGCAHDPNNAGGSCTSYGFGHEFTGDDLGYYGTIMSYLGQEIQHFSDPDILFQGQPTGIANLRDNARVIQSTRTVLDDIYLTRADIWVDFTNLIMPHEGTFLDPYRFVADGVANLVEPQCPSELPTLWIKAGTTNETLTISKPMQIRACGGTVRIGD